MKRNYSLVFFAVAFLLLIFENGIAGEATQQAVISAASRGLSIFLKQIPQEEIVNYGFNNLDEFKLAQLGKPVEIFTIPPDDLLSYSGLSLGALLRATGNWYVPVQVRKENRALLTVTQMRKEWEVVGISAAKLARELQSFETQLSDLLSGVGAAQQGSPKFVRLFQAQSDFMFVPTTREEYLFPFSSARSVLQMSPDKLMRPDDVVPFLKMDLSQD
jgi:hypothetical protein